MLNKVQSFHPLHFPYSGQGRGNKQNFDHFWMINQQSNTNLLKISVQSKAFFNAEIKYWTKSG